MKRLATSAVCALNLSLSPQTALAEPSPIGIWLRESGTARVQIAPCGDKLCGNIVWVRDKDSPTKLGMRVFYDMEAERPNVWSGKAFNPEDKQTYSGTLAIVGDKMTTTGCVIGRLVCVNIYWSRVK